MPPPVPHIETRGGWREAIPVVGSVDLPPDPRALESLGRNHSLETALADLVDNSIDAGATYVLIRLVRQDGYLRTLYVVDNGKGMTPETVDAAMTVGGHREYGDSDLGRFGLGLKAASFSQADDFTVLSRAAGRPAVGRRWRLRSGRSGFQCDIVSEDFATGELRRDWNVPMGDSGTVIRWDHLTCFPATNDSERVETFVARMTTDLFNHLGLVFHRFLSDGRIQIALDVTDVEHPLPGARFTVTPKNPFAYSRPGLSGYPKELRASLAGRELRLVCHVWPPRSTSPEFRLPGGAASRQGLYFYRRDRLLQAGGGWGGLQGVEDRLQLARVEVDIDDDIAGLFRMNPEKSKVVVGPEFGALVDYAEAEDRTTFAAYLKAAEERFKESRQRKRQRKKMLPLGDGFSDAIRDAVAAEIPTLPGRPPIHLRWRAMDGDEFFDIDRHQQTLWLNERYRRAQGDTPLLKALLYLLMEDAFQGEHLGPRDRDNIDLWQAILTAAVTDETLPGGTA
ncbi:ATP-binding protein [Microbispora bryophytorum]|uniref:ATP-binding protein n=1 Tax=Microbispora bryophytorum TaxID=1460882 RepID=A0A8H9L962_9ACTN|nr:ATP-binding protein [Microbispora bryophytorum]TQS09904.1 ATP-binding protein [Microbispora bryophytorum]GGN99226.1 hypothetical protein GCM10011574_04650 [Microbispora bryophytorum]